LDGADLQSDASLTTAVLISVFTDQTAAPDDIIPDAPPGQPGDPRGWWGDEGATYPIGSRLWLYGRAKQTEATLNGVQDAIQSSLQWLVDDKVAAAVTVKCWWRALGQLAGTIVVTRVSGAQIAVEFSGAWGQA
jgi:phage gp46-like protein